MGHSYTIIIICILCTNVKPTLGAETNAGYCSARDKQFSESLCHPITLLPSGYKFTRHELYVRLVTISMLVFSVLISSLNGNGWLILPEYLYSRSVPSKLFNSEKKHDNSFSTPHALFQPQMAAAGKFHSRSPQAEAQESFYSSAIGHDSNCNRNIRHSHRP